MGTCNVMLVTGSGVTVSLPCEGPWRVCHMRFVWFAAAGGCVRIRSAAMGDDVGLPSLGQHEACAGHALHRGGAALPGVPSTHPGQLQALCAAVPVAQPQGAPLLHGGMFPDCCHAACPGLICPAPDQCAVAVLPGQQCLS